MAITAAEVASLESTMDGKLAAALGAFTARITQLENDRNDAIARLTAIENALTTNLGPAITSLRGHVGARDFDGMERDIRNLQALVGTVNVPNLATQVTAIETTANDAQTKATDAQNHVTTLEGAFTTVRDDHNNRLVALEAPTTPPTAPLIPAPESAKRRWVRENIGI